MSVSEIDKAETALKLAELNFGPHDLRTAECLVELAKHLRQNKTRLLDAVNMEARAKVIFQNSGTHSPVKEETNGGGVNAFGIPYKKESEPTAPQPIKDANQPKSPPSDGSVAGGDMRSCPFCAETIKAKAIKCRYCGELLGSAPAVAVQAQKENTILNTKLAPPISAAKRKMLLIAVVPILLILQILFSGVRGATFLRFESGQSEILRGQRVFLCRANLLDLLKKNEDWQLIENWDPKRFDHVDDFVETKADGQQKFFQMSKSHKSLIDTVMLAAICTADSNEEGRYRFDHLAPGSYYLYSEFLHPKERESELCLWVVPVTILGFPTGIDLTNSNAIVLPVSNPEK